MRDFPKRLATAEDIRNCKSLVDDGAFAAKDLLEAIEDLENMNYLHCPILAVGEDKKTVTINYCAEAKAGTKAIVGNKTVNITNVRENRMSTLEIPSWKQPLSPLPLWFLPKLRKLQLPHLTQFMTVSA